MSKGGRLWFWHVLALALGMTVAECQERVSASELTSWRAFAAIEPFGDQRADIRSAIIAHTFASAFTDSNTQVEFTDFLPFSGFGDHGGLSSLGAEDQVEPGSEEEFLRFTAAMGAKPAPGSREETMAFLNAMGATRKEEA